MLVNFDTRCTRWLHLFLVWLPVSAAVLVVSALLVAAAPSAAAQASAAPAQNVILVMTDGLRWQEVFRGADESLLTPERFYDKRDVEPLRREFLASTPEERRERLLPFFWKTIARQGQVFGDRDRHSDAQVTNGFNFSYPGYSETLTGHGDPRIHSNDNVPNPNRTVLEWLNGQPGLKDQVAAFGAWEVIAGIVNADRCGCVVNAGYAPFTMEPMTPRLTLLNAWKAESPRIWDDEVFDAPTFYTALEYIRARHPRVLFLSLGETDDWAHEGNYGEYLLSAHRVDAYLAQLWSELQSMPEYRGRTSVIFTTDHGRGSDAESWKSHGQKLPDSRFIFIGLLGPGVAAAGVHHDDAPVSQSQIAATAARLLGQDWNAAEPQAGRPLPVGSSGGSQQAER